MRLGLVLLGSIALLFLALVTVVPAQPSGWLSDDRAGRARAANQKKPLLIYFHNREVRACRDLEVETMAAAEVSGKLGEFVLVAINNKHQQEKAQEYRLIKVPTVILLDPMGKEIDRAVGYKNVDEFTQYLDRALDVQRRLDGATLDISQPSEGTRPITFTVRPPRPGRIFLVGDFNDWREGANPLQPQRDGTMTATIYLRDGVYEYKFLDDRGEYYADGRNPNRVINAFGTSNSILIVGATAKQSPVIGRGSVNFYLYRPEAREIQLAGSFNNWQPITMYRHPEDPAMWGVGYELSRGDYKYKYIIDGEWTVDPENYSPMQEPDGTINSSFRMR